MRHQPRDVAHDRDRALRRNATPAEQRLWFGLRHLRSFKFRRQHRIGRFIVDFYCASVKLAVEVDGSAHSGEAAALRDEERDAVLREMGVRVLRIRNELVLNNLGDVVHRIEEACCFL